MKSLMIGLLFLVSNFAQANYVFTKDKGSVEFKAKGWPSLLKINGTADGVSGTLIEKDGKLSGDLTLDLKSLKTGIDLRDNHLKDNYLKITEEGKGTAKLTITDLKLPENNKGKLKLKAKLRLNNVEKEIAISGKLKPNKKGFSFKAEFDFKITDFKIAIPSFKGITVAEDVKVKVDLLAVKEKVEALK